MSEPEYVDEKAVELLKNDGIKNNSGNPFYQDIVEPVSEPDFNSSSEYSIINNELRLEPLSPRDNVISHETGDLENTSFLLQKLQELKNWQKLQEDQLMKEQQFQLDQLLRENKQVIDNTIEAVDIGDNNVDEDEDDDDTTIDQDLSSLHSEVIQSLPSWASRSRFVLFYFCFCSSKKM